MPLNIPRIGSGSPLHFHKRLPHIGSPLPLSSSPLSHKVPPQLLQAASPYSPVPLPLVHKARPVPQLLQLVNLAVVILPVGVEQIFIEGVFHLLGQSRPVSPYKLLDKDEGCLKGPDLPILSGLGQLPPCRIGVGFGIDQVEYILHHLPLVHFLIQIQ